MNEGPATKRFWLRQAAEVAALACAYLALERLSSIHEYKGLPFTAWDPGLGLLFAAIILRPWTGAIALFVGIAGAQALVLHSALDGVRICAIAGIIALVYLCAALALGASRQFDADIARLRSVVALLSFAAVGALCSAILVVALLVVTGDLKLVDMLAAGTQHVVGDVIGIAVVTPLVLKLMGGGYRIKPKIDKFVVAEAAVFIIFGALFFWLGASGANGGGVQYFYVLFAPAMLAAVRHGQIGASLALAATQAMLVLILEWRGAGASEFTAVQTLMLVLTATALVAGATVSERNAAARAAESARLRAREMEEAHARTARFNLVNGMASALSHEINQPLTAARARARIIEKLTENGDWTRVAENVPQLVAQIDRASEILQHTRAFLRRGSMQHKQAPWAEIAGIASALLSPLAAESRVGLSWREIGSVPQIRCDSMQISQVVINLVANAIEAIARSGKQGAVSVEARPTDDGSELEVAIVDDGPGIDPGLAPRIFESMATTREEGLGLGLAICAAIVDSHHGRLWLQASFAGRTEFRFRLPSASGDLRT